MELTEKSPPWGLAFMVPEANTQPSKGGSQPTVIPSYDTYKLQQWSVQHDSPSVQDWHKNLGGNQQLLIC